jgi:hypothetical protein
MNKGFDRDSWLQALARINQSLQQQGATARLTLVGSATGILMGQPDRSSVDLDVWRPTSRYEFAALKKAVEDAGLVFNPKSALDPETPYVQLIEPGIVQIGMFEHPEPLEKFGALQLDRPPIANLVASKLVRAETKDIEDITYLLANYRPARGDIAKAIQSMPAEARRRASENLVYVEVLSLRQPKPPDKDL